MSANNVTPELQLDSTLHGRYTTFIRCTPCMLYISLLFNETFAKGRFIVGIFGRSKCYQTLSLSPSLWLRRRQLYRILYPVTGIRFHSYSTNVDWPNGNPLWASIELWTCRMLLRQSIDERTSTVERRSSISYHELGEIVHTHISARSRHLYRYIANLWPTLFEYDQSCTMLRCHV